LAHVTEAGPEYDERLAYLNRLEAVVRSRNPQYRARAARQEAGQKTVRQLSRVSFIFPPGVNPAVVPFVTELVSGMQERLEQLPDERTKRAVARFTDMSAGDFVDFTLGYLKGLVLGIWGEIKGIVDLITLPYTLLKWVTEQASAAITNWDRLAGRLTEVQEKLAAAIAKAVEEIGNFLRDPADALKRIDALIDAMIGSGLRKANQWGQQAVDETLEFLEGPLSDVGEKVGHVVGVILFNVILLVATDAIGNLVKEGASLLARLAGGIAGKVAEGVKAIRALLPKVVELIRWLGDRILTFLADSLKLVTDAIKALEELLGAVEVVETAGPGGVRIPIAVAEEAEKTRFLATATKGKVPGGSSAAMAAAEEAALTPYSEGLGHHVPAKSAFRGHPAYSPGEALAISNEELARLGIEHSDITGAQASLYRQFAKTGKPLTWKVIADIETQALVGAKMEKSVARATVKRAIDALKAAGVAGPTRIPWGGK
jgi:hypothetical protein